MRRFRSCPALSSVTIEKLMKAQRAGMGADTQFLCGYEKSLRMEKFIFDFFSLVFYNHILTFTIMQCIFYIKSFVLNHL